MIKLDVDGVPVETDEENLTLLDFLRENLDKDHVNYSCRRGLCGCCAVKINGTIKKSCTLMLKSLEGQSVSTAR